MNHEESFFYYFYKRNNNKKSSLFKKKKKILEGQILVDIFKSQYFHYRNEIYGVAHIFVLFSSSDTLMSFAKKKKKAIP